MRSAAENGATTLATYSYDPLSRRTGLAYGNGASVTSAYSAAGDLTSLVHDLLGTADDATTTLTYTPAHQLGRESVSNAAWDRSPPTTATVAYTPNGLNQYTTVGGAGFVHDAQGNLTSDGARTFAYDAENRLLTATVAGTTTTYAYDPRGRRTARLTPTVGGPRWGTAIWGAFPWTAALAGPGTTFFLDSGDDEIAEYDSAGTVARRFVPGPAIDEPIAMVTAATGAREYLHANHQGSIAATSDDTGALAEGPLTYDAYGACYAGATNTPCATSGVPYRFTGRRYDPETGLYYYRARYYDPIIGRFLQTDPVGYGPDLDWYSYVGNDPGNKTDPAGKDPVQDQILQEMEDRQALEDCGNNGSCIRQHEQAFADKQAQEAELQADVIATMALPALIDVGLGALAGRFGLSAVAEMTMSDAQFGAKAASHMSDFGLDVTSAADRTAFRETIESIGNEPDSVVNGTFSGQGPGGTRGPVQFRIKGLDVVVTTRTGKFITVLKGGINNTSVQRALKAASCHLGSLIGC